MITEGEPARPVHLTFGFDAADPIAVTLTVGATGAESIVWRFARRLLADGARRPVGLGDVRVRPIVLRGQPALALCLSSPSGTAEFELPARDVAAFLWRTYAMVAADAESGLIDWSSELRFVPGMGAAGGHRRARARHGAWPHHAGA
ncbi:SsgA family sporulation/cell division regulator [Frankia canadensis]|uniref:SsgA family sporulation/cell division regulator n=1 Tax=Frankia canadensis TaxID=1836972 RepID=UPI001FAFF07C|nr:SsgA family sporulation/cell division regulator [Frankia canadensis]